jgi:thiol-disulfide isomerase/thioredoxin
MASFVGTLGFIVVTSAALACESKPAPQERTKEQEPTTPMATAGSKAKPHFEPGKLPVSAFVAERIAARRANAVTVVYVGATWCEPCQRFHRALAAGELDAELGDVEFIDYDFDVAHEGLNAAGYRSKFIPLFALPKSDGSSSGRQIEGGIKGDGTVDDILQRLQELTLRRR